MRASNNALSPWHMRAKHAVHANRASLLTHVSAAELKCRVGQNCVYIYVYIDFIHIHRIYI